MSANYIQDEPEGRPIQGPYVPPRTDENGDLGFESIEDLIGPNQFFLDTMHQYGNFFYSNNNANTENIVFELGSMALNVDDSLRYIWPHNDPTVMPGDFYQVVWHPKNGTRTADNITEIVMCYPELTGIEFGIFGDGSRIPNDIILLVKNKTGQIQKYLINSETPGAVQYDDGKNLRPKLYDVNKDGYDGRRPDAFYISPEGVTSGKSLTVDELNAMTLRDSNVDRVPKP